MGLYQYMIPLPQDLQPPPRHWCVYVARVSRSMIATVALGTPSFVRDSEVSVTGHHPEGQEVSEIWGLTVGIES